MVKDEITQEVPNKRPMILEEDIYDLWIDLKMNDTEYLKSKPVSPLINYPKNDVNECFSSINSM
ncbi:hypothetical protein COD13_28535 [Priestia megaterium]|uniref:hypothetical protein n=1 Tax=Priestia megaterium TaxID=1404 RepID=UPI000BF58FA5|nr:hypothetical protein [Priestia megaterium]PFP32123.1 hypothetical protein COK03_28345 [Priestia megaterium]PGT49905.1 hypothetical protein COD13_28535 [Priestia megaterium]